MTGALHTLLLAGTVATVVLFIAWLGARWAYASAAAGQWLARFDRDVAVNDGAERALDAGLVDPAERWS